MRRSFLLPLALLFLLFSLPAHATFTFSTNFSEGASGVQVYVLQQVLNRDADTKVAISGPGSPGQETSYFGLLTRAAVMRFQQKYASSILVPAGLTQANGFVGFYTRGVLNSILSGTGVVPPTIPPPPPPPPYLTPSASGTTIPSASQIVDGGNNVWTESNGLIYRNNVPVSYSSSFTLLLYYSGNIYQENTTCLWWVWNGSSWIATANPSPTLVPACTPPTQPVSGSCGSSNNTTLSSAPTNLCSSGSPSNVSGSGPWTWSCLGSGGGNNVSCSANITTTVLNGVCGSSNNSTLSSAPTNNLCASGTASNVNGSGPWEWSCLGSGGGNTDSCSAMKASSVSADGTTIPSAAQIVDNAHNTWTVSAGVIYENGNLSPTADVILLLYYNGVIYQENASLNWWSWNGSAWITTTDPRTSGAINGQCGSSNGTTVSAAPMSGLCSSGSASNVSGSGPWSWNCSGSNGGSTASCSAAKASNGGSGSADNYPRLGGYIIGDPQTYDSGFQSYAAKLQLVIIGGNWETWQQGIGYGKESVISSIKAQSKVHTRVFQYVLFEEANQTASQNWDPTFISKVDSMNWWLYNNGTSGNRTSSSYGANWGFINMTSAAPKDSATGLGPFGWGAKYANDFYHLGSYSGTSAASSLDGFFLDNVFWKPRIDGDWDRNGSTDSQNNATVQYNFRAGEKNYFDEMKSIWPSGIQIGNVADWGQANDAGSNVAPLSGVLSGGVLESALGNSDSPDTWGGASELQKYYQYTMNNLAAPKYLIVSHDNVTANGADPYGPAWQAMRYGLTVTLMNDGYYYADNGAYSDGPSNRFWFDEYDGGGIGVGYLGQPVAGSAGAVQTSAWSNGIWKREFQNGIVLWNPKGNGARTVNLSGLGGLKHINGNQNHSVNNGADVTNGSVPLQDRDGLILLRD